MVFVDEAWVKANMARLHGWASWSASLTAKVPHCHWKTATFLAPLRNDRIDALCLFDGPINGERLLAYVAQFLVPTLKPGEVVVLENFRSHRGSAVRMAIWVAGTRLAFLPKYSPDLNPNEQAFAKLKTLFAKNRRAKRRRRLRRDRSYPRHVLASRMLRAHQRCWICANRKAEGSSRALASPAERHSKIFAKCL